MALRGAEGLNCACTLRSESKVARNRCKACSTIKPEIIALVVAIAGIMFPAISKRERVYQLDKTDTSCIARTFNFPPALSWNTVRCRPQISRGSNEIQRIVIIFVKRYGLFFARLEARCETLGALNRLHESI